MREYYEVKDWFREYYNDIFNFLIYYTGTKDVEDLIQETFLKAVRNIHNFKGDSNPKTWLISIARNASIDESRKRRKEKTKRNHLIFEYRGTGNQNGAGASRASIGYRI